MSRIEAQLREHHAGPRLRQARRASQSRPIVERFQRALVRLKSTGRYLPQSLLGQAMDYTLGQWPTLAVYLADGRVEVDNNLVENAIRPTAIGKKTSSSSAMPKPVSAVPSFTPSLKVAADAVSIPSLISATCSRACPP